MCLLECARQDDLKVHTTLNFSHGSKQPLLMACHAAGRRPKPVRQIRSAMTGLPLRCHHAIWLSCDYSLLPDSAVQATTASLGTFQEWAEHAQTE